MRCLQIRRGLKVSEKRRPDIVTLGQLVWGPTPQLSMPGGLRLPITRMRIARGKGQQDCRFLPTSNVSYEHAAGMQSSITMSSRFHAHAQSDYQLFPMKKNARLLPPLYTNRDALKIGPGLSRDASRQPPATRQTVREGIPPREPSPRPPPPANGNQHAARTSSSAPTNCSCVPSSMDTNEGTCTKRHAAPVERACRSDW